MGAACHLLHTTPNRTCVTHRDSTDRDIPFATQHCLHALCPTFCSAILKWIVIRDSWKSKPKLTCGVFLWEMPCPVLLASGTDQELSYARQEEPTPWSSHCPHVLQIREAPESALRHHKEGKESCGSFSDQIFCIMQVNSLPYLIKATWYFKNDNK